MSRPKSLQKVRIVSEGLRFKKFGPGVEGKKIIHGGYLTSVLLAQTVSILYPDISLHHAFIDVMSAE
jgi:hypothetical protein